MVTTAGHAGWHCFLPELCESSGLRIFTHAFPQVLFFFRHCGQEWCPMFLTDHSELTDWSSQLWECCWACWFKFWLITAHVGRDLPATVWFLLVSRCSTAEGFTSFLRFASLKSPLLKSFFPGRCNCKQSCVALKNSDRLLWIPSCCRLPVSMKLALGQAGLSNCISEVFDIHLWPWSLRRDNNYTRVCSKFVFLQLGCHT